MTNNEMRMELAQAIDAGERALSSLREAAGQLDSAGSWGLFDLLGGGTFTSLVKHAKLGDAREIMEQARRDMERFERELRDVTLSAKLDLDTGGFLAFADMFMDNVFADYLVQRKISQAKKQVAQAAGQVESIVAALRRKYREL